MAKVKSLQSEFKFRKSDTIGAASAEDDKEYLESCFVVTEEYEVLKDQKDIRQIVLGRTGTGKSALFERLKHEEERVISIEPHHLALTYVSNSSVIKYFADLGVNLDPFYKLLWRHVLTVEILKRHFESHANSEPGGLWNYLMGRFSDESRQGKEAEQAVRYLREWGEKFWVETEFRVREITTKLEEKLTKRVGVDLDRLGLKTGISGDSGSALSEGQKIEVLKRGQRIVSEAQVQDLGKVIGLLNLVLSNQQKCYYVLIDRLDEDWVEEKLRYRLILALIESLKEISEVNNVKVLVAIRRDLIDRVFKLAREAGFQEEKYQSRYLQLNWSSHQIMEVLDKRIDALVARRYQKSRAVKHSDLLPKQIDQIPIRRFITERARRPRDVISFFNNCIDVSAGLSKLSVGNLKLASM